MTAKSELIEIIDVLTRRMGEMESQVLAHSEFAELSMRQLGYIEAVARLGHPTFSELAQELGVSRPSVTAAVNKLTRQGLVAKVASDEDRRVAHLHLTPQGERVSGLHADVHRALAALICRALKRKELKELVRLLQKVAKPLK